MSGYKSDSGNRKYRVPGSKPGDCFKNISDSVLQSVLTAQGVKAARPKKRLNKSYQLLTSYLGHIST